MRYRVVAVPATFIRHDSFVVEDQAGQLYLFEHGELSILTPAEASLALTVFELSQSFDWHTADELPHLLGSLSDARRYRFSLPAQAQGDASALA